MNSRRRALALVLAWVGLILGALVLTAPAQADEVVTVRVGTEGTYPPFTFHDPSSDELTGYDIDVIREVADRAGWELEFVEAQYLFSTPYTFSQGVIVTAADNDDISTLEDLRGRTMAQNSTSNWAQVARDAGGDVRSVESLAQAAELLEQGRVDALVNDNIAVLDYLAASGSSDVKIAGVVEGESTQQAFAFRKDGAELRDQADEALAEMVEDGTLTEISESYFKSDVSVEDGGEADLSGRDSTKSSWQVVQDATGPMLKALVQYTISLSLLSMALGLAMALVVALARLSARSWLRWPARAFISVIRGTPLLVQLFLVFYGLPQVGIKFESYPAAVLALSLNVAAYSAEIIRASILSVPRGQSEAAATVGMGYALTMRRIVLPQAARTAVPPLSNTFISLVKDTSLASGILVAEMFRIAQNYAGATTEYLPLYALAALFYWIVCAVLSVGQIRLETRLERHTR